MIVRILAALLVKVEPIEIFKLCQEIVSDLSQFLEELKALNAKARVVLTVSPVPLVATATGEHVLAASTYSKAVLRVACQEITERYPDVVYFPAYEIVNELFPHRFQDAHA